MISSLDLFCLQRYCHAGLVSWLPPPATKTPRCFEWRTRAAAATGISRWGRNVLFFFGKLYWLYSVSKIYIYLWHIYFWPNSLKSLMLQACLFKETLAWEASKLKGEHWLPESWAQPFFTSSLKFFGAFETGKENFWCKTGNFDNTDWKKMEEVSINSEISFFHHFPFNFPSTFENAQVLPMAMSTPRFDCALAVWIHLRSPLSLSSTNVASEGYRKNMEKWYLYNSVIFFCCFWFFHSPR